MYTPTDDKDTDTKDEVYALLKEEVIGYQREWHLGMATFTAGLRIVRGQRTIEC